MTCFHKKLWRLRWCHTLNFFKMAILHISIFIIENFISTKLLWFFSFLDMAFSKTPRVLITDELSRPGVPGPCDYDPNDASEKRIKGFSIREEDIKKERRQSSGRDPRTMDILVYFQNLDISGTIPSMDPWFRKHKNKLFGKERYISYSIETGAIFISDNSKKTIERARKGL